MPVLSNKSRERLEGIKPVLIEIIERAIIDTPIDFGIPPDGGLRTAYRQNQLYAKGRTEAGQIITWVDGMKKRSRHQDGDAFDIYAFVDGKASWDPKHYEPIARHLQGIAWVEFGVVLIWGGDGLGKNKVIDLPHFELKK
jgi:peptidoglycan L-alanyl-D-glutamate endopeptidase CwlK